jgi:hypothetical protein
VGTAAAALIYEDTAMNLCPLRADVRLDPGVGRACCVCAHACKLYRRCTRPALGGEDEGERHSEGRLRAAETKKRRNEAAAAAGAAECGGGADRTLAYDIICHIIVNIITMIS